MRRSPLMIGSSIGAYRVISQLGAGGMGVVYEAFDERLQRRVALKVLADTLSSDQARRRRFLQEARAASALNDPHIVTVHDIIAHEGTDVLVMELVVGRTLRDAAALPAPIDQAVGWVRQIADALTVAHAAGIVHRDLKPGNVMVTDRGLVKVLDFGLAKVAISADEATLAPVTSEGDVLGTVEYMSPEQARGAPADHRSDVYALGTMLYELLAGRRPFVAENRLALLHEILHGELVPLRVHRPEVPAALEDVVRRSLERDARQRFQSMWEFSAALATATSPAPPTAVGPLTATTPAAGGTRSRSLALAVVAVALAVAVVAVVLVRRSSTPLAPAASSMPAAAEVPAPSTPLAFTQQGLGLLRRFDRAGNVDKAIASFESAIALDKTFAPAWAGLARAYWRQQKETRDAAWRARAIDAASQAIALDALLADGHVSMGLARFISGDIAGARQAFDRALTLDPANAGAHRGLGDIAEGEDRFADATREYQLALASDAGDWELPRLLGDIPYQAAQYADAVKWYARSAEAAPDSPVPHRLVGAANHMLGDYAAAAAAFQKSLSIQPTAAGYTNLGTALFFQGGYRESLQAFERAVELAPSNPLVWGNVADAYRWVPGNTQKSKDAYARAIQMLRDQLAKDPAHVVNRSRLALYLAKSGDPTTALTELAKVLSTDVQEVQTLYRAAVTYELARDRDAAMRTLEQALTRGYSLTEVRMDPELTTLRNDVRYHRLAARFERPAGAK